MRKAFVLLFVVIIVGCLKEVPHPQPLPYSHPISTDTPKLYIKPPYVLDTIPGELWLRINKKTWMITNDTIYEVFDRPLWRWREDSLHMWVQEDTDSIYIYSSPQMYVWAWFKVYDKFPD